MSELTQALAPAKMRPWHELVIDMIIANPTLKQGEIAKMVGRSQTWLSIVMNGDMFKARLAERKEEIVDPALRATVDDRFRAVANGASEEFLRRLELAPNSIRTKDLVDAMAVTSSGLGMGPSNQPMLQQNLYVVPAPPKTGDTAAWKQAVEDAIPKAP